MPTLATNRKQRLRTLEDEIRKASDSMYENGLEIGRHLCEIRDDHLWADEYESWNQYLKDKAEFLVGKSFTAATKLVQSAEIAKRLPSSINVYTESQLSASHMRELSRLVPDRTKGDGSPGREKDYSQLRKQDVARVLKKAAELSGTDSPSVRDIRKAVDIDQGIDRAAKAKDTKDTNGKYGSDPFDLPNYLTTRRGLIEGITSNLAKVPGEAWEELAESHPKLAERLAEACDELASLLRS
jgi:hypothetical protein